jgi:hypothetical protein
MALEAPHEYVAFVERHLPRLRRDAALIVGAGREPDELYPEVLTDVAARWRLFQLLHRLLGRSDAADEYLRRAFARRARRWQDEQITPVEVQVWQVETLDEPLVVDAWPGAGTPGWAGATGPYARPPAPREQLAPLSARAVRPASPTWTSMALRLAPVLLTAGRRPARPLAEAAVAWWHAYEAQRRRKYVVVATAFLLLLGLLTRASAYGAEHWSAPAPATVVTVASEPAGRAPHITP